MVFRLYLGCVRGVFGLYLAVAVAEALAVFCDSFEVFGVFLSVFRFLWGMSGGCLGLSRGCLGWDR